MNVIQHYFKIIIANTKFVKLKIKFKTLSLFNPFTALYFARSVPRNKLPNVGVFFFVTISPEIVV